MHPAGELVVSSGIELGKTPGTRQRLRQLRAAPGGQHRAGDAGAGADDCAQAVGRGRGQGGDGEVAVGGVSTADRPSSGVRQARLTEIPSTHLRDFGFHHHPSRPGNPGHHYHPARRKLEPTDIRQRLHRDHYRNRHSSETNPNIFLH